MASDWQNEQGPPETGPHRARRRGPSRGQILRRRLVAIGSLVVVVVAVVIVLTSSGGDEDDGGAAKLASGAGTGAAHQKKAKASKSTLPSSLKGVKSAGMEPLNIENS